MTILDPHPEHPIVLPLPTVITTVAALVDCLCEELTVSGGGPVCWCGAYPGASVSWEYCSGGECTNGACGMAWVRPAAVFPYDSFPIPSLDPRCERPLAWAIEVGVLRCMPQPDDGELLPPDEMLTVTMTTMLDARAIHTAIKCCDGVEAAVEQYTPVGPLGGCVGGFWTAYLDVPGW